MSTYDAIVLGLGGMGSAAAAHVAARSKRVLGLEQFTPAHDRGSSHGQTRIIRQAYWEDPAYVPLLLRAYDLWLELERKTGRALYLRTGGLMVGSERSSLVSGSRRSALDISIGAPIRSPAVPLAGVVREGDGTQTVWVTADRRQFTQADSQNRRAARRLPTNS